MRKLVLSLAAAGTALVFAAPAAAQYYPQPQYGYGNQSYGYGQSYGYQNSYRQLRALQARIDAVQYRINQISRYNGGGASERLRDESRNIERRLRQAQRFGLNPNEVYDIQARIARLEQRVNYAMSSRYGRYGRYGNGYNSYGNGYGDGYGYGNNERGYGERDGRRHGDDNRDDNRDDNNNDD